MDVYINGNGELKATHDENVLGGVTLIETELFLRQDKTEDMYQEISIPRFVSYKTQLVPYFVWSNRGQAEMTVFMPAIWRES